MKHFINLKDIAAGDLRKIIIDAKRRKILRKKLNNLEVDKGLPLKGKLLIQMFEKSSLRTRLSFYLAIKQLGGSTLTLRPDELHLSHGGESIEDTAKILSNFGNARYRSSCLSHAKRALYQLSYIPFRSHRDLNPDHWIQSPKC